MDYHELQQAEPTLVSGTEDSRGDEWLRQMLVCRNRAPGSGGRGVCRGFFLPHEAAKASRMQTHPATAEESDRSHRPEPSTARIRLCPRREKPALPDPPGGEVGKVWHGGIFEGLTRDIDDRLFDIVPLGARLAATLSLDLLPPYEVFASSPKHGQLKDQEA